MAKVKNRILGWSFGGWPERFPRTSMRIETRAARRMRHLVEERAKKPAPWPKEGEPLPPALFMRPSRQWIRAQLREDDKANPKTIRFQPTRPLSKAAVAALERRAKRAKTRKPRVRPKAWKDGPSGRVWL